MGVIPLADASGRPYRVPIVTAVIIAINLLVFLVAHQASGGVAYGAHVGDLIFGAVTARLFEDRPARAGTR